MRRSTSILTQLTESLLLCLNQMRAAGITIDDALAIQFDACARDSVRRVILTFHQGQEGYA
jgi:hypothetical protein